MIKPDLVLREMNLANLIKKRKETLGMVVANIEDIWEKIKKMSQFLPLNLKFQTKWIF